MQGFQTRQKREWERKARLGSASSEAPHFAPDADMLAIQRRRITAYLGTIDHKPKALILGATPELADLALQEGLEVVCVDSSAAMFEAAAKRRQLSDRTREKSIAADWLDMNMIAQGEIDIVLGDASLNNIAHEEMGGMLDELTRVTHSGSLILLRQIVFPDQKVPEYDLPNVLAAMRSGKISKHDFDRVLRFYCFAPVALDPARHMLDAKRVFEIIRQLCKADEITIAEFEFLMSRYSEVAHTIYPYSEQIRVLERLGTCDVEMLPTTCFFRKLMAIFAVRVR